jgi:AhpD family alkylhydroperoxidase
MGFGKAVQDELREPERALRAAIPAVYAAHAKVHSAAFSVGALDRKTKELIALAVAVSAQCDGCIAAHARQAARCGARPDEVAEALGVVIALGGGAALVYAPRAFAAYNEFDGESHIE